MRNKRSELLDSLVALVNDESPDYREWRTDSVDVSRTIRIVDAWPLEDEDGEVCEVIEDETVYQLGITAVRGCSGGEDRVQYVVSVESRHAIEPGSLRLSDMAWEQAVSTYSESEVPDDYDSEDASVDVKAAKLQQERSEVVKVLERDDEECALYYKQTWRVSNASPYVGYDITHAVMIDDELFDMVSTDEMINHSVADALSEDIQSPDDVVELDDSPVAEAELALTKRAFRDVVAGLGDNLEAAQDEIFDQDKVTDSLLFVVACMRARRLPDLDDFS